MTGIVDRAQAQSTDFDHLIVVEEDVVSHVSEHRRVERGDCYFEAGFAHGGYGLNVIVVAVRLEDSANSESRTQLEQLLVFVGGVDQDGVSGLATAHHEHVVVVRADHQLVHFDCCIVPVEGVGRSHATILAPLDHVAYGDGVNPTTSLLASTLVPGLSAWKRRRALSVALLCVGVVAPIVVPVVLLMSSGGLTSLLLDPTSLGLLRIVLVAVVLTRVVAVAEVLVASPGRAPVSLVVAVLAIALVAVPCVWGYGRIGNVSEAIDDIFVSAGSSEPLAQGSSDDSEFSTILLVAGEEGTDRFDVRSDSIVLITTHRSSGRTTLVSIDAETTGFEFADGSPLDTRHPTGYREAIGDLALDVESDADLAAQYRRGELAPGIVALTEAVSVSLDVTIEDYVFVHLDGVQTLVDVLGGVSVASTDEFVIPALDGAAAETVGPGEVALDGSQAYRLVSTRTDASDYALMVRQRAVIQAIGRAVSVSTVLSDLPTILNSLRDSMRSSMSGGEFADFLGRFTSSDSIVETFALSPDVIDRDDPDWTVARSAIDGLQSSLVDLP